MPYTGVQGHPEPQCETMSEKKKLKSKKVMSLKCEGRCTAFFIRDRI